MPVAFIPLRDEVLKPLGLGSLEQVKAFDGELVKNHKGSRDILRIRTRGAAGSDLVLYLKRSWRPHQKDGLASLLRHGRPWSISRREWENSIALVKAGFATARPVSFGEEAGLLWEKFSFLITEAAAGSETVAGFLKTCRDRARRRHVLDALAREIRRFHDAGFATPDMFTRHIFVDADAALPRFCCIDMGRPDRRQPVPLPLRARPRGVERHGSAAVRLNARAPAFPAALRGRQGPAAVPRDCPAHESSPAAKAVSGFSRRTRCVAASARLNEPRKIALLHPARVPRFSTHASQ